MNSVLYFIIRNVFSKELGFQILFFIYLCPIKTNYNHTLCLTILLWFATDLWQNLSSCGKMGN